MMAKLDRSDVEARDERDGLAAGRDIRAFAGRHPEICEAFRDVLRECCPAEYEKLLEIEGRCS
jgi:hypothetical protein